MVSVLLTSPTWFSRAFVTTGVVSIVSLLSLALPSPFCLSLYYSVFLSLTQKVMFALGAIPALILLLVAFVIPESFVSFSFCLFCFVCLVYFFLILVRFGWPNVLVAANTLHCLQIILLSLLRMCTRKKKAKRKEKEAKEKIKAYLKPYLLHTIRQDVVNNTFFNPLYITSLASLDLFALSPYHSSLSLSPSQ